ncbi:MAG: MBL fold metallo-hydrolase [Acidobacteria bacterium]|nr:MBL fold metallo-hydrolase [Acidobacteriota bacterium]
MKNKAWPLILAVPLLGSVAPRAVAGPTYTATRLSGAIYQLSADAGGYPVKVLASIGPDGILLVDTGPAELRDDLRVALAGLMPGVPRIIINTHSHVEHLGGNTAFGAGPLIIGHAALRARLRSGPFLFDELPDDALPRLTFVEEMRLHFNGEEIRLVPFPGAHDDSDVVVWFTGSKIAAVGGVCNGRHFPSVDGETGDVTRYPDVVARLIALLPPDVLLVPGHGENGTLDDARAFHDMLVQTAAVIRAGLAAQKDAPTLEREDVLARWKAYEIAYADRSYWVRALVKGYGPGREARPRPWEQLFRAWKQGGIEAVRARYAWIKANEGQSWLLDDKLLFSIGYRLLQRGLPDARAFFQMSLDQFPKGSYAFAAHELIGDLQRSEGDLEGARASYRRALELQPGDPGVSAKLEALGR